MYIENLTTKFLNKIAKTKKDSSVLGGLFVGFALGFAFFVPEAKQGFGLIDFVEVLIISAFLFCGILLTLRGR